ncbi:uncharacterized protein LOC117332513 [Pecten maximus]|uniref:uncharacterized protein LOC117332513 n=1 Tax=Pecten maximus TaxID=6579 RepID=UPI00145873C8|nr:uncharacterized protein LOC117332513 [Pecten maximus]XP_033747338.1 uncharacterized protein LOC117332513 [Pecten maximus]XP_033747339.1 uncharacterized protein LOC117332513 [Pecten maximus]
MDVKYFGQLSLEIGKEWSLLAYELGFSDSQLDHLRSAFPYNIQQCIACMLAKWHETVLKHRVDPLPLLTRSLAGVDRYDLVQKLNSDFDDPDTGPQVNESNGNLVDFHATLRKIRFGHIQGDMQMYMDQTQRFLEFQMKDKSQFVNTRAAKEAFNLLSSKGTITLIGNPGDGKSAIAVNLLNQLQNEGLAVLVLSDPALIERIYDDEKQIVYFVDDAFGTPTMNMRLLETWTRLHDKIESLIKLDKCKLLLTSRKHVYMKCQSLLYKCPSYRDNLVDLSGDEYRLSMIEKKRIAANHCQGHGLFPPQLGLTNANVYVPGFPLLCKMFANDKRMQELDVYLDQTLSILHSQLQLLATTDVHAFCGLVLIMMFDGRLPRDVFDQFSPCDEQVQTKFQTILKVYGIRASEGGKVVDCLDEMIGVYVEEIEEEFRFIHDAIFDTICLLFGTRYPNEIIRVASSTFIEKRIRTEHIPDANSNSLADVIILKKSKYHVLAARWIKDASRGIIRAMFINPSIRDVGMQLAFADRVMKLPPQAAMDLLTSVESKTSSTSHFEETVLFLACQNGLVSLVKALMEKQKILKDNNNLEYASRLSIPDICMMESVNRIHLNVVQVLLDNGAMVNFAYGSMCDRCLHVACKKGSLDLVKLLLRHGADVNLQDHNGKQAVHFASEFGHLDILKEFGTNNASLSVKDNTGKQAIHYAGKAGSLECVQFLLQEGIRLNVTDRMDKTVLHYASTADYPDLIRHLVSKGAYTNSPDSMGATPLHFACKANLPKNVAILLSNGADPDREDASMCVPLHSVCKGHSSESDGSNSFQCVELLLNVVSDVNAVDSYGKTALHYACAWARDRRLDCVTLLLSKGANPNITDDHGHQPVFYACESGNLKCLQALVNHGIDVNHRGHQGKQPIHYACGRGNIDVVKMLVAKGASITSVDDKGKQPIHYASQHGNDECANYLLDCNIDVNCVDERGWRPLHYACKWCRPNAVRLLMSKGAASADTDNDNKKPDDLVPNWSSRRSRIKRYLRGNSLDKNAFE